AKRHWSFIYLVEKTPQQIASDLFILAKLSLSLSTESGFLRHFGIFSFLLFFPIVPKFEIFEKQKL
ncbi:MAG: hypothetical protein IKZ49_01360, partial [Alphaproteobacteria bacterium]|nr:hypothetical protein [Alphaproteobacteria bacterium]